MKVLIHLLINGCDGSALPRRDLSNKISAFSFFRMKSCVEIPFGISIDEDFVFQVSLVLLCFFSSLLLLILFLIVWLGKIQHRVASISKNTCSLPLVISNKKAPADSNKRNSCNHFTGAVAYGPLGFDGDEPRSDLQETSFVSSVTQGEDGKSDHDSNTQEKTISSDIEDAAYHQNVDDSSTTQHSSCDHPERYVTNGKLRRMYMSLKSTKDNIYSKPCVDLSRVEFGQGECSADGGVTEMNCDERQRGKDSQERQKDSTNEDDHGYLLVIHSNKATGLSDGAENEAPPHEDESLYLIPMETESKEKRAETHSDGRVKADDVSEKDARVSSLDNLEEDKYGYLSSQHVGKLTTFGHNVVSDFQQTHPGEKIKRNGISKSADEDGYGYLLVQHVEDVAANGDKAGTNIPVCLSQAGGIPESGGPVDPSYEDENSYDYITAREVKDWSRSPDSDASKLQKNYATGRAEPGAESATEESHDYLTVVHEREENNSNNKVEPGALSTTEDCHDYLTVIHERANEVEDTDSEDSQLTTGQENTTDQIYADINDNNNNYNAGAHSEVIYVNQEIVPNVGAGVDYPDDVPLYANNEFQQESFTCNDNPAFYDESPIYDNDMINV